MSNDPTDTPVVEQTEEVIADPVETGEQSAEPAAEQTTEEKGPKDPVKALQRRVDKRTADFYREKARADQLAAELEQTRQGRQETQEYEPEKVQKLIEQRAEQIAQQRTVAERVNKVEAELRKELKEGYDDFYVDLSSSGPSAKSLIETVLELDDAPRVMAHLAKNRDELYEALELTPRQQALKLARISVSLESAGKQRTVSTAPKPISPVGTRTGSTGLSDDLPMEEWVKRRNEMTRRKAA